MKIWSDVPESTKPERAWLEGTVLMVEYHQYRDVYYIDMTAAIMLEHLVSYTMYFGKRKGFKRLEIFYRHPTNRKITMLSLSKNHQELVLQIYRLLKTVNIKPRKEVITNEDKHKPD